MAKGKFEEWITPEGLLKIEGWARDGLTDEQIAYNMGIRRETLYAWKKRFNNITNALKRGKEVVDRQVENALLKRALGFEVVEEKYVQTMMNPEEYHAFKKVEVNKFKLANPDASMEEIRAFELSLPKTKSVLDEKKIKHVAPDVTAQIFWLKNRKPREWRDKQEIEHSGGVTNAVDFTGLTTEELRAIAKSNSRTK